MAPYQDQLEALTITDGGSGFSERDFGLVADEVSERDQFLVSVGGRVTFIPEAVPGGRSRYRPTYGVDVEAVEMENCGTASSPVAPEFSTFTAAQSRDIHSTY